MPAALRTERIEARVPPEAKATIEQAAGILGVSVSSFLVDAVQSRAFEVIRDYQVLRLSGRDSEALAVALLADSRGPNAALHRAAARHKQEVES